VEAARAAAATIAQNTVAPGLAAAVVQDGRIVWSEGFGYADAARRQPALPDTLFRIGSLSKLLTATTLARLVARGAISLDAPVNALVPEYTGAPVTFRQLAGHLGGIRNYAAGEYVNTVHYATVPAAVARFGRDPLIAAPGEKYAYSSYGYTLLGAALERALRVPYLELVRREVLRPMHMRDTGVEPPAVQSARVARFYDKTDEGEVVEARAIDLSDRVPAGGLLSTADDLARFAMGTLDLPPAVQALLFTPQQTSAGQATGVGLGWRVATDDRGRRYVHHGGDSLGGRAFLLVYPEQRLAVALLANLSFAGFSEKEARALAEPLLAELTPAGGIRPYAR
jgi:CubicO group peptidase (beta-lactamase class C family)